MVSKVQTGPILGPLTKQPKKYCVLRITYAYYVWGNTGFRDWHADNSCWGLGKAVSSLSLV